ncbi:protein involved in ribonucleotide reduction [bacterium A37T11]|nr:protein involved in ribonucleotide reduction [bacterium A37T11]
MEWIYYDSKTGNVDRFVQKIAGLIPWKVQKIMPGMEIIHPGHLITFTTRFGEAPETTTQFLNHAGSLIKSVSASGNRNWGKNFALAANKLSAAYELPLLLKFELSGTMEDVKEYINLIKNNHDYQKMDIA